MRAIFVIISAIFLAGCVSQPPAGQPPAAEPVASSALVFDPPIAMYNAPLDLSRSTRGEAAFAGFEDTATTYFDVWTDDRQTTDSTDRFVREGFSEKIGATRR